jgi:SAM-dependent methyltransferase
VAKPLKHFVKSRLPLLFDLWRRIKQPSLEGRSAKQTFTRKFHKHVAQDMESASGPGSDLVQTEAVRRLLPPLLKELRCTSLLDVPCGDFYWMRLVEMNVDYIGADVVDELIQQNHSAYGSDRRTFMQRDLLHDALPRADVVLCRDCLVHFSNKDVVRALANIRRSGATYLLTTTFVGRDRNDEIPTGKWRAVNLQRPPFDLPEPLRLFDEAHPSVDFSDKHLGLWRIADLPDAPLS